MKMIVKQIRKFRIRRRNNFTANLLSFVSSLPEETLEYTLYMLETDPQGLFIKYYLLSVAAGEPNANLRELMNLWDITEGDFIKYRQELIEEGLLNIEK